MLDSVTNYECWKGIYSSHNDKNYFEIAYSFNRQFSKEGIYKDLCLYNFLDNHDVNRIGSLLTTTENLKNVYTMLYMMPGIPSIYYGSEWGVQGEKGSGSTTDDAIRPNLNLKKLQNSNFELMEHIKKLAQIRSKSDAIKYGDYKELLVKNEQFVFARKHKKEKKIVAFNLSERQEQIAFQYNGKNYELMLKPYSSYII